MSVRLNGSTSGYTELDAPAVAGNNTMKMPASNGAAYQIVRNGATPGSLELADKIVSGTAQASTSGTSIDFTGIPSWVKRVTVMFNGVSTNGASAILIQLGTSSGVTTSGYLGSGSIQAVGTTGYTAGLGVESAATAAAVRNGHAVICGLGSNVWTMNAVLARSDSAFTLLGASSVTLSGTLDRVRITTVNGTDTFDAGTINILYE